jgi:sucrose phosphorylase
MKNKVQLIAYIDRCGGGGIADLHALLRGPLTGLFGGVHLLPFFHPIDGADAGFDPIDHTQVDPRLGTWDDLKALSRDFEVMADVIVNHMSDRSPQFRDFVGKGSESQYAELFLTLGKVFPHGATERDLAAIYRPRPGFPFTLVTLANGERRVLWTTFTPQQVDIDVRSGEGARYLEGILDRLAGSGVRMIRLDAVGYAIKKAGTSCFMTPGTFDFIGEFATQARLRGIEVLVEIHAYYRRQIEIAARVDWVYDFALPPLVLHALAYGSSQRLREWLAIRPANSLTVLDTHDGIGVIDIGADSADRLGSPGLVPPAEIDGLVTRIHELSRGESRQATGAAASNLDLYQVNCTFYDALGRDDRRYLIARALQFFIPGVPQVYYVGLLAGTNDMELLARSRVGRDINRHHYSREEIVAATGRPVVTDLFDLIRLRNSHPAFDGSFSVEPADDATLSLRWSAGDHVATLRVGFRDSSLEIRISDGGGARSLPLRSFGA